MHGEAKKLKMVEVFKTNVGEPDQSDRLIRQLYSYFPDCRINFDLEDRDRILRVEGASICADAVISIVTKCGYQCLVLE